MRQKLKDQSEEVQKEKFLSNDLTDLGIPTEEKPVVVAIEMPKTEKIVFINNRDPGVPLQFHYHSKTHPLHHYTLFHGKTYDLPVEVIYHLEGESKLEQWTCHMRKYGQRLNADGVTETYVNGYVPYYQCKRIRA